MTPRNLVPAKLGVCAGGVNYSRALVCAAPQSIRLRS